MKCRRLPARSSGVRESTLNEVHHRCDCSEAGLFSWSWFRGGLAAQEYKVEALKQAPPSSISPEITAVLNAQGYRVVDGQGKPFAEIWLRKAVPASAKPAGPSGVIQFPFLQEGELLGVIQLESEGHDYRDQAIPQGLTPCGMVSSRSTATTSA